MSHVRPSYVVALVLVAVPLVCAAAPVPDGLLCEWRAENQAVRDICPELYWQAEGQTACEVLVATSEALLEPGRADMWDTGRIDTRLPIVEYAGGPLADQTTCFWKVRAWDADGGPGQWSAVQRFTTDFRPRPSLRPHLRYFVNFCPGGPELVAGRYDLSFCGDAGQFRAEHIGLRYALMATMVVPSGKCEQLAAWCAREGLDENLSPEGVPEAMYCHFATETSVTLHVGAEQASNPRETRAIPGWDPRNDRNGDGLVDDDEFANLINPEAGARRWRDARIPVYYWGPPRDDYVMNIGHPDYQRFLAEEHLPAELGGCAGWWIDTTPPDVPGAGRGAKVVEYPRGPGEEDKWLRDMQTLMAKVKIAHPDVLFSANSWEATPFILDGRETEGWLNMAVGAGGFESRLRSVARLDARGKFHLAQYNPIWAPERSEFGPKVPISLERDHRYALAAYYLCAGDHSYFGYGRHGGYGVGHTWYQTIADYDIGEPRGEYEKTVISRAADAEVENLLANGDFETDADGDGLPDAWVTALPLVFDEEIVKSGRRSVRIDSGDVSINNINKGLLSLKPNTTYTFSGWVRTESIVGGSGAQMYIYDFEGGQSGGISMVLHGTNDWTFMSQTFSTAADAEGRVNFRVYGSTGTAWFDDLRVVEGAHSDVVVYARRFTGALVLVRPSEPALGWGDETAIEYELDGRYRPLDINGEPGEPVTSIALRLGEAAILVPQ